ncbi:IS256 family transposase [Synergistaceae bacterium DZ-S4]|uniref:IS256 family transposase n=1 Tax=Cloacibacillus sp. DZ-S5 TaxID=3396783 RepID=UPI003AE18E9A
MSNLLQELKVSSMEDIHDLFKEMIGTFLENGLEGELDEELGYTKYDYKNKVTDNSRNGTSPKKVRSSYGEIDLNVPRDRKGEFEPELVKKQQTSISGDIEEKILSMYAKGMTTSDIETHIRDIYGLSVSDSTISRITDKILPLVKEWQSRPLESVYAVVFMDAIHFHVRSEGQIIKKAVYIAIGINMEGTREVLGMWIGENESAKFWLSVLNGLKNRGLEDILIACVDGLSGFPGAIEAAYPKTEIQQCIIHQIRNSTKYVSYKDIKVLMSDLKEVYAAVDEQTALDSLERFADKWDGKYPKISKSWQEHWANLSTYFKYPLEVRTLIYTTNTIEGFNRQLRKVTKSKTVFPTDDSLLKMLYLAMMDITKKWTGRRKDWGIIHSQLEVFFEGRI